MHYISADYLDATVFWFVLAPYHNLPVAFQVILVGVLIPNFCATACESPSFSPPMLPRKETAAS